MKVLWEGRIFSLTRNKKASVLQLERVSYITWTKWLLRDIKLFLGHTYNVFMARPFKKSAAAVVALDSDIPPF